MKHPTKNSKTLNNPSHPNLTSSKTDPLVVIFEQHLFHFQDANTDRKEFIEKVVQDYLFYLRKLNITVPKSLEPAIVEELGEQVNTMLVKKIYGCYNIQEFQKTIPKAVKKRAKSRYSKLQSE